MEDDYKALAHESRFVYFVSCLSLVLSVVNFIGFYLIFKTYSGH